MLLWTGAPAWPDGPAHHILWEIKGRHNTVFLLGSVHLLRPDDRAFSAPDRAANRAEIHFIIGR